METYERISGSGHVSNPRLYHPVDTAAHLAVRGACGVGHESGPPAGWEEDASETSQGGLLEEMRQPNMACEELTE